jgi:phage terminase small subunit
MKPTTTKPKAKPAKPKKISTQPKPLNVRQERFCEFVASGMSGTEAWLQAGYDVSRNVARANAAESLAKPAIIARIAALRAPQTRAALLSKDRKREIMRDIAESPTQKTQDRLRAIEIDAKLAGDFAPEQHVIEAGPKTLDAVRERAKQIGSPLGRAINLSSSP